MKRRPSTGGIIWATRRDLTGCYVTVTIDDQEGVRIGGISESEHVVLLLTRSPPHNAQTATLRLTRREARLLAKRLNQCLDATARR